MTKTIELKPPVADLEQFLRQRQTFLRDLCIKRDELNTKIAEVETSIVTLTIRVNCSHNSHTVDGFNPLNATTTVICQSCGLGWSQM